MGRKLMRVPLDFNWPIGKIWEGYLDPYYQYSQECPACGGTHLNPPTRQLHDDWYDFDGTGRRWDKKLTQEEVDHLKAEGRLNDLPDDVTADQVNNWAGKGFGHDSINMWLMIEFRAKKLGFYGHCEAGCDDDGRVWNPPEMKQKSEEWKNSDPPAGNGYQLWETTTEGSPITPVFKTLEELCEYAAEHCSTFGEFKATASEWRSMLDKDFVYAQQGHTVFI